MILKGIGKIDGDGWKDVTRKGEKVFVYRKSLPRPYIGFNGSRQYERVGNIGWTASTDQFDFVGASFVEFVKLIPAMLSDLRERRLWAFRWAA